MGDPSGSATGVNYCKVLWTIISVETKSGKNKETLQCEQAQRFSAARPRLHLFHASTLTCLSLLPNPAGTPLRRGLRPLIKGQLLAQIHFQLQLSCADFGSEVYATGEQYRLRIRPSAQLLEWGKGFDTEGIDADRPTALADVEPIVERHR